MANEIFNSGLGDLRLAAALHQEIALLLADRASLWRHPSIVYYGDMQGSGSDVLEIPLAGLGGYNAMAAVAENASTSNTALTDASPNITIARQALQRQISDLAVLTDSVGLNVEALAQDMVGAASMRFMEMVAAQAGSFTSTVGSTTVDLTVANFLDATFTLTQHSVPGPYIACLYPTQVTDLLSSLRSESGPIAQWEAANQELMKIKGPGFQGSFVGVDIFASSKIPTANAGADSDGGMWGYGAIGYAEGTPRALKGAGGFEVPAGSPFLVEFERDSAAALTKVVGNYYVGVSIIEDSRGVAITTDR